MTSIVVDGTTYCDDNSCANTMLGKGYATHFFPMVADVLARVVDAETAATNAAAYSAGWTGTSTTSIATGAGSKTFTTQSGKLWVTGTKILVARTSAPTTWMYGEVTSYSGTSLVINVSDYLGSGTYTDWTITLSGIKGASGTSGASLTRSALSGVATLGASDNAKYIEMSGTWTLGFSACATLASGWWCVLVNAGTGLITVDPNSTEQIDGVTSFVMYPGEARLVVCSGSALYSTVTRPFSYTFTAGGTFTKPPGYAYFGGLLWGAGGGGGKRSTGGPGGGGGACVPFTLAASAVGTTETITIGDGGAGATTDGGTSSVGGDSSIGSLVTAYGGGGTLSSSATGAAGGGGLSAGSTSTGGAPILATGALSNSGFGGAFLRSTSGAGYDAAYGGAGGANGGSASAGGRSIYGGGGGASSNGSSTASGGTSVFGGAGGASATSASGTAGSAPAGGGGGTLTGTAGGAGGRGELRIWGVV